MSTNMSSTSLNQPLALDYRSSTDRLASHAIQHYGGTNMANVWGNIFLNRNSADSKLFLDDSHKQFTIQALVNDYYDDGTLNASSLKNGIADSYWRATGQDIRPYMAQLQTAPADFSYAQVFKPDADPTTAQGFNQIAQNARMSPVDLLWQALWGHEANLNIKNGQIFNEGNTTAFLNDAINNKQSIDWPLVNMSPQTLAATQQFAQSPRSDVALNSAFLAGLEKTFGAPTGYLTQVANQYGGYPYGGGGYNPYGFPFTYGQPYGIR